MVRLAVIASIIVLALMIFSIIDCSRTPESQIRSLPKWAWLVIIIFVPGIGALACAILVLNNLRDLPSDEAAGKKTLAVVMGDKSTRDLYKWLMFFSLVISVALALFSLYYLFALLSLPLVSKSVRAVSAGARRDELITLLAKTGRIQIIYSIALSFAAWLVAR